MTQLRDYQVQAMQAVKAAYDRGLYRVGVSLSTGLGKTVLMGAMANKVRSQGAVSLTLVHRDVLVEQTVRQYSRFIPDADIGIIKASKHEIDKPVLIASVHSLRNPDRLRTIPRPALTIVDESHVSVSDLYLQVYEHLDAMPGGKGYLVGLTATWSRSDKRGLGDIWQEVVFRRSLKWAVENGFLVPPRALQLGGSLDLSEVRIGSDGDFNEHDLGEAVMLNDLKDTVVDGYHRLAPGRSAVLFAPTQKSARYFGDALRDSGVNVADILADTGKNARKYAIAAFNNGAVKVLTTCTALSTGFDAPICDTALMVRPTRHIGTFIQMVGRTLRPWPSKSEALILDYVGVTDDVDMRSVVDLSMTSQQEELPVCSFCGEVLCPTCGACLASQCPKAGYCRCEEFEEAVEPVEREHTAKKINGVHQVDLFAGTNARWLKTHRGVPFIATRDALFFVSQVNGAWNVGQCSSKSLYGGKWLAKGVSSSDALEIGSEAALDYDPSIADKRSSWRQGNRSPSDNQKLYAQQLGINPEGMSKATLADAISIQKASRVLAQIGGAEITSEDQ